VATSVLLEDERMKGREEERRCRREDGPKRGGADTRKSGME
jgi:hypothetical protein